MTKYGFLLFLLLFTIQTIADTDCSPVVSTELHLEEDLIKIQDVAIKKLPILSVSEDDFPKANCTSKKLPLFKLDQLDGNDPRLVSALEKFTTHTGYCASSENNNCQRELPPEALKCKDARCKLVTLFGKRESELMMFALEKFNLNTSALAFSPGYSDETFKNWDVNELQDVLLAAMDMPPQMTGFQDNQQLTRRNAMKSELFSGTLADSRMTFNGLWAIQPIPERRTSAFHEFGHTFSDHFSISKSEVWKKFSGWEKKMVGNEERWISRKPTALVSQYGVNPEEDFAESVTAFRYNPKLLQSASPDKYRFIKEVVFGGVEYIKKNKCLSPPPLTANWQDEVKKKLASWELR